MKIHIVADFHEGPWGGGNQFLKTLRKYLIKKSSYAMEPEKAQAILFNSHHNLKQVLWLRRKYPGKIFIHRIDGPMSYRGASGTKLDKLINEINVWVADATVFQSAWSRAENLKSGFRSSEFSEIIYNCPDPEIFYPKERQEKFPGTRRVRLAASSWSGNNNKGFDIYRFLDGALDFSKYEMTFVGNYGGSFSNIRHLDPMGSLELGDFLRSQDVYVLASRTEACSNSLLEAVHCGLPVIARDSSSNPEVLGDSWLKRIPLDVKRP